MNGEIVISLLGLILALIVLTFLVMKGINIFVTAFICVAIIAITSGMSIYDTFKQDYMAGFAGFFQANWLMFLTGSLIGSMMRITGAAESIAAVLIRLFGVDKAVLSIPIACGVLAYGGVSAFVCAFAVYQIALNVFQQADLPRQYMPAALCFGCSTFAMVAPGAVQIHNTIIVEELGTPMMSGMVVGFIACGFMLIVGSIWLYAMLKNEKSKGNGFVEREGDKFATGKKLPNFFISLLPLVATILSINTGTLPPEAGITLGIVLTVVLLYKETEGMSQILDEVTNSFKTSIFSITNTCAVVGFGTVVQSSKSFPEIINAMTAIPGPPLFGILIGTMIIAGVSGSASGGIGIASKILGPIYVKMGLPAEHIHRVMAISSSSLDSLPHNGYIITVTNSLCGETHADAYPAVFKLTVVVPFFASIIGVILFTIFPNWP